MTVELLAWVVVERFGGVFNLERLLRVCVRVCDTLCWAISACVCIIMPQRGAAVCMCQSAVVCPVRCAVLCAQGEVDSRLRVVVFARCF